MPSNKILTYLKRKKIIGNFIEDKAKILFLQKIWGDKILLRAQLSKMNKKERQRFLDTCDYETKWERYAFTRLKNHIYNESRSKLSLKRLIEEIETYYKFEMKVKKVKKLLKIRKRIYNQKQYQISLKKITEKQKQRKET